MGWTATNRGPKKTKLRKMDSSRPLVAKNGQVKQNLLLHQQHLPEAITVLMTKRKFSWNDHQKKVCRRARKRRNKQQLVSALGRVGSKRTSKIYATYKMNAENLWEAHCSRRNCLFRQPKFQIVGTAENNNGDDDHSSSCCCRVISINNNNSSSSGIRSNDSRRRNRATKVLKSKTNEDYHYGRIIELGSSINPSERRKKRRPTQQV